MLQKLFILIFFNFSQVKCSDDYILDFVYVDLPTTVTTTTIGETTTEVTTTEKTTTSTSKTHFTKTNGGTSLYDPRDFNKDQFTKIEVDFETQFEAKRREKDRNASDTDNSEASGSQNEGEPSDFEIIEPLNVPLVSRNDRQNDAIGKKNAAADLEKINESFQQAFDQMFDIDTKVQPKNLKKVRKTKT